ncbi:MAG: hypothetical protein ACRC3Y_03665 [Romboutsia sp.]|uniref:hypothetical protein n=1 Tax=Romboutsia sp. TaxID=1965302 RepID=UPI003F2B2732
MTSKHNTLLKEFIKINTDVEVIGATEMVGEPYALYDGIAVKVELKGGNWLRVYRNKNGEINWY